MCRNILCTVITACLLAATASSAFATDKDGQDHKPQPKDKKQVKEDQPSEKGGSKNLPVDAAEPFVKGEGKKAPPQKGQPYKNGEGKKLPAKSAEPFVKGKSKKVPPQKGQPYEKGEGKKPPVKADAKAPAKQGVTGDDKIAYLFGRYDTNGDGVLSLSEFKAMYAAPKKPQPDPAAEKVAPKKPHEG
jgi:hypothetical protein